MPLEKDNPSHRSFSDSLDATFGGGFTYKKLVTKLRDMVQKNKFEHLNLLTISKSFQLNLNSYIS